MQNDSLAAGKAVRKLYTLEGFHMHSVSEFEDGQTYVAAVTAAAQLSKKTLNAACAAAAGGHDHHGGQVRGGSGVATCAACVFVCVWLR